MALASLTASGVRASLGHPVIDADGHMLEFGPTLDEYLRAEGVGRTARQIFVREFAGQPVEAAPGDGQGGRAIRRPWWNRPTRNTGDLLTAALPQVLYERLDELGLDFMVLYPTSSLGFLHMADETVRRGSCRAINRLQADLFGQYRDRIEPAALVPAHTPQEALEELEFATTTFGYKVATLPGYVRRAGASLEAAGAETWLDLLGLDSAYDYDPVWQRCVELDLPVSFHSGGQGWEDRHSPSSFMFNHLGSFAAGNDALCRSLFLGGVTSRFPDLRVAFLEGGVSWAVALYCDLIGHWEKRNVEALANYDPTRVDWGMVRSRFTSYAGRPVDPGVLQGTLGGLLGSGWAPPPDLRDEWKALGVSAASDLAERFVKPFYFGCEADDPLTYTAFNARANPFGASLKAMFSSDIGHWDVPDMSRVLPEAFEAVEHQMMSEEDFRRFTFSNAAEFYGGRTGRFFEGTRVEADVCGTS